MIYLFREETGECKNPFIHFFLMTVLTLKNVIRMACLQTTRDRNCGNFILHIFISVSEALFIATEMWPLVLHCVY